MCIFGVLYRLLINRLFLVSLSLSFSLFFNFCSSKVCFIYFHFGKGGLGEGSQHNYLLIVVLFSVQMLRCSWEEQKQKQRKMPKQTTAHAASQKATKKPTIKLQQLEATSSLKPAHNQLSSVTRFVVVYVVFAFAAATRWKVISEK